MQHFESLFPGNYYHIYNRGINRDKIFIENTNYHYFLILYEKYIQPIADTYAWCLMPNHFHFLIRVFDPDRVPYPYKKVIDPSLAFSHLFNSYAQAFNKRYERTGGLFQTPFQRKLVENEAYFKKLVFYIHNNPVKHCFTETMEDYPWSSFKTFLTIRKSLTNEKWVTGWFDNHAEFHTFHSANQDLEDIVDLKIED